MSKLSANLQKGLVGHWTMDKQDIDTGVISDRSGYRNHGTINNPTENRFGPNGVGYWRGDVDQLGAVDGFKDVGESDATTNDTFEDIFTNQFGTSDFENSGSEYYVYMAFAAKWNEIPTWGLSGTWLKQPDPDPNKYQLYVLRSDGQNSRDEYFRIFYGDSNDTGKGRIADPFVWTQDDEDGDARIIGSGSRKTVEPYTEGVVDDAMKFDGVGEYVETSLSQSDMGSAGDTITFSFWINQEDLGSGRIFDGRDNSAGGILFEIQIGRILFWPNSSDRTTLSHDFSSNNWHHCAIEYNDSEQEFTAYVDGEYIGSSGNDDTIRFDTTNNSNIGRRGNDADYLDGKLSDFRIYNRALSESEIEALYNMRSQRSASV